MKKRGQRGAIIAVLLLGLLIFGEYTLRGRRSLISSNP